MTNSETKYQSISCSLYDELEALAVKKTHCVVEFAQSKEVHHSEGIITNIFANDGAEFMTLNNETTIRLDYIKTVNGIPMTKYC